MTHSTRSPRFTTGRRIALTALGVGAGSFACMPLASADPLTDAAQGALSAVGQATGIDVPATPVAPPAVPTPAQALGNFATQVMGVVPSNLVRTDSAGSGNATEAASQQTPMQVARQIDPGAMMGQYQAYAANPTPAPPVQSIPSWLPGAHNGAADANTIGQLFGAATVPTGQTIDQISRDVQTLVANAQSGQLQADIQTAIDNTVHSDLYQQWRDGTSFAEIDHSLTGVDRAASGIATSIDAFSANPVQALSELLEASGGPLSLMTDPVGTVTRGATLILGPDMVRNLITDAGTIPGALMESLAQAAPALLAIPAGGILGALLGAPLGALPGAGVGAILGALNPLAPLVGLLTALPGALLGGLATGLLGLGAAGLISLGSFLTLPPALAAGASALALAALATVTYGLWLASLVVAGVVFAGLGAVAGVAVFGLLMALAGGNPLMIPAAISGGVLTALFVFAIGTGGYALLTFLIPTIAFLLLAPPLLIGSALAGFLAGLGLAGLISAMSLAILPALAALPGALAGGILGYLIGDGLTRLVSALVGSVLGGLIGGLLGSLLGGLLGSAAGAAVGIPLFIALALTALGDRWAAYNADPNSALSQLRRAADQGWRESRLGQLLGMLADQFAHTGSGQAMNDIFVRIQALFATSAFLDGRRLREMLLRGGLLGALMGAPVGALTGGTLGALAGLLSPLNLLNGLMGAIAGAIPGALLGAAGGKLASMLLGALTFGVVTPLSFLPILTALGLGYLALAAVASLGALAVALIPPIALATGAWLIVSLGVSAPLWLPLVIVATIATLATFIAVNPAVLIATGGGSGVFAGVAGTVATIASLLAVVVIGGSLLVGLPFVWLPVFALTAPLFVFPALLVPLGFALGLPGLIPVAAGLSILTGLLAGTAVDNLSSLLTIPAGALLGGLVGATIGGVSATVIASLVRSVVYGLAGAVAGGVAGAGIGGVLGALAALITHLRVGAGVDPASQTGWFDGRIVNQGGFGDILSGLPGLSGQPQDMIMPVATAPVADPLSGFAERSMRDVSELVPA